MVVFEVESGIPLPTRRTGTSGAAVYPFARLEVDKSFFVAPEDGESIPALQRKLSSRASQYARAHAGQRFETRVGQKEVDRDGDKVTVKGVRVWRTA